MVMRPIAQGNREDSVNWMERCDRPNAFTFTVEVYIIEI